MIRNPEPIPGKPHRQLKYQLPQEQEQQEQAGPTAPCEQLCAKLTEPHQELPAPPATHRQYDVVPFNSARYDYYLSLSSYSYSPSSSHHSSNLPIYASPPTSHQLSSFLQALRSANTHVPATTVLQAEYLATPVIGVKVKARASIIVCN